MEVNSEEKRVPEGKKLEFYREAVAELEGSDRRMTRYRLREWKPIYTRILVCVQKGMSAAQIAAEAEIGFTASQIGKIVKDPLFRLKLSQYNKKMDSAIIERATEDFARFPEVLLAKDKLAQSAEKAADVLLAMLKPTKQTLERYTIHERRLMISIAQDVLNRAGLKSVVAEEDTGRGREYSPEEIKSALENAKELEDIAARLDNRGSSYVLTNNQRRESDGVDKTCAEGAITSDVESSNIDTAFGSVAPQPENEVV